MENENMQPQTQQQGGNGLAIAGMIVSIVSIVLCWIPLIGVFGGIAGLVLGIVALKKGQKKGFAITAIIVGAVAILAGIIMWVISFALLTAVYSDALYNL